MDATTAARVTEWLRASRGTETQEDLAADITAKTGWRIMRDRYSKYESGKIPIGPKVYGHFLEYWKARGVDGPSLTAQPVKEPEQSLAGALSDLAAELKASREERDELEGRLQGLEEAVRLLAAQAGVALPARFAPQRTAG